MTRKQNVLVFPCGSEIGLELFRSLSSSTHVKLFGASSVSCNHGRYLYENYIEGLPYVDVPEFIDALNRIIDEHEIDFLFPAHDSVVLSFAVHQQKLNCKVIGSSVETCRICRSKRTTYEKFVSLLKVPELYARLENISEWPIFLKPDIGQDSRGTYLAHSYKEAKFYVSQDSSLLPMEYLPGAEYTVDCFTDCHGCLRFVGARERIRVQNGISVHSRPVNDDAFHKIAKTINYRLELRGVWFFRVKKDNDGQITLMEIAPRMAGTMSLYRNLGVNFALLSIFDAMGLDVDILCNECELEVDHALSGRFKTSLDYQHLYIDLDDCLICEDKVNLQAITLLFQCLNRNIKLHLLTRHADSVEMALKSHRLNGLFDEIIHLQHEELKSSHIKHRNAVFIDDSFAERKEVRQKTGIPVFAPDAIECLLNT